MLPNALREDEGIGPRQYPREGGHLRGICCRAGSDALERGLRRIVAPQQAGAAPLFALQFHRGLKQILEEPQLRIERIERALGLRRVVPIPAHEFAHMRPVLLFHMGVVILLLRARAGERDGLGPWTLAERDQMMIDEFAPIV